MLGDAMVVMTAAALLQKKGNIIWLADWILDHGRLDFWKKKELCITEQYIPSQRGSYSDTKVTIQFQRTIY
jgi:hypothetical protein